MSKTDLRKKVRELKELKIMADELGAEITALEDEIKAEMTAQGTEEMTVDVFTVRYKTVITNRFNSAAFKHTHADLYSQYIKPTVGKRFPIA